MDDSVLRGIDNYRRLTDLIDTAGQPKEEELAAVARALRRRAWTTVRS